MAATTSVQEASKALKFQTWVLKVSIHCQGCSKKVRKVLQSIDGVYTTSIDSQQQRVTVTGIIGAETLIRKLVKSGKHAEMWPEMVAKKDKESSTVKNMHKPNDSSKSTQSNYNTDAGSRKSVKFRAEELSEEKKNVETSPSPGNSTGHEFSGAKNKGGGSANGGKKKKKKGQAGKNNSNGMGSHSSASETSGTAGYQAPGGGLDQVAGPSNLGPARQHLIPWQQGYFIPQVHAPSGYSMAYPSECNRVPSYYYVPSFTRANAHQTTPSSDSFYIFNDENVNGCCVM